MKLFMNTFILCVLTNENCLWKNCELGCIIFHLFPGTHQKPEKTGIPDTLTDSNYKNSNIGNCVL